LWQTHQVRDALCANEDSLQCHIETMNTAGDRNLHQPLPEIGGKGLFTEELNHAIRQSKIDVAVHSLKDLPTLDEHGILTIPVLQREDPRDVLIARDSLQLDQLPTGATVGTSSPRRKAQILARRPDLNIQSIRGNVPTRVAKVLEPDSHPGAHYDAIVMAAAGIIRLGLTETITEFLPLDSFLPAPGQGCIGATCRPDDPNTVAQLSAISDHESTNSAVAERQLLFHLGGGCSAPIAAYGRYEDGHLTLTGRVASLDGKKMVTETASGNDPHELARNLADTLLRSGAERILQEVFPLKNKRVITTRAADENHALAGLLQSKGAETIAIPLIKFAPTINADQAAEELPQLDACDRIVFTSANGVRYFNSLIPAEQSLRWRDKMFFVGPKTAQTMQRTWQGPQPFPLQSEFGETYSARDYAQSLDIGQGEKIIAPAAVVHMKEVVTILSEKGADVSTWPIYATSNETISEQALADLGKGFDAILFVSPSAVKSFCEQVKDYRDVLKSAIVGCIGNTTASRARDLGIEVQVVPERFTTDDLVDALANYFGASEGGAS
jgi:hydroxymethylbilane synthase